MKNKALKRRILDISYKYKLSHIGSCITAVDIIADIYEKKKPDEPFILSSGHAGLALYCVLEKYHRTPEHQVDAEELLKKHGVHPNRDMKNGIWCSTGSLGQGLPIAVGMALSNRNRNVYCLISDGECAEGSIWESANILRREKIKNMKVYMNINYWSAYRSLNDSDLDAFAFMLNDEYLYNDLEIRITHDSRYPEFLQDQEAHYVVMNEQQYKEALEVVS